MKKTILFFIFIAVDTRYSEPYIFAEEYIKSSDEIALIYGDINSASLSILSNYHWDSNGKGSPSFFKFNVSGSKRDGELTIYLRKPYDKWKVIKLEHSTQ